MQRSAAHPQHAIEIEPGGRRRQRIEPIERIDERHEFAARRGRRQRRDEHAGPARRSAPEDLGDLPAPPAAAERGVQRRNPSRRRGVSGGAQDAAGCVELLGLKQGFELLNRRGTHIRFSFAFWTQYRSSSQSDQEAKVKVAVYDEARPQSRPLRSAMPDCQ